MPAYDTSALLKLIRQQTHVSALQQGYTDADTLALATAELHGSVLPALKAERQELWLSSEAATYSVPVVDGQAEYPLPARAVGAGARKVVLVDSQGQHHPLRFLEVDKVEEQNAAPGVPYGYTVRGARLVLCPVPQGTAGYALRVPFHVRPAAMVLPSACGVVTSVSAYNPSGTVATVRFTSSSASLYQLPALDVVRGTSPFDTVALEAANTSPVLVSSGVYEVHLSVAAALPRVGDYVCAPDTAPVPQFPVEAHPLLAARVAAVQLSGTGALARAGAIAATLPERRKDMLNAVVPRVEGEARKVRNGMRKWRGC